MGTVRGMIAISDYDALITRIYEAGIGEDNFDTLLSDIRQAFDAASAGFTIYDEVGKQMTHIFFMPPLADAIQPGLDPADLWNINQYPDAVYFGSIRINSPRRFTDVIPSTRLQNASWFRRQVALTGLGHGMMLDIGLDQTRVRLFITRMIDEQNFSSEDLDLLALIGRHLERAFRGKHHRFSAAVLTGRAEKLMSIEDTGPGLIFPRHSVEYQLCRHCKLTPMEARVAVAIGDGKSRDESAGALGIGINTLKTHAKRVYNKLEVSRQSQVAGITAQFRSSTTLADL
jgi:DNA-binding CsgD family transcriptional regulator